MRPTELLQEVRQMRFEEAYGGWKRGRLTQEEAARILGVCDRTFRRYTQRFDDGGMEALLDKRISQASHRLAPVDEVMALAERYRKRYIGWNARHFHSHYRYSSLFLLACPEVRVGDSFYITGVAGFIGSHVAERLLRRGDRVHGLDNFDPFYDRSMKEGNLASLSVFPEFRFTEGDIRDPAVLASWGNKCPVDAVIHLAAKAGVRPSLRDPVGYSDVNVLGTARLLEWARDRNAPRILFASSSSVYGGNQKIPFAEEDPVDHPVSPYAATKKAGELLCHTFCHLYGMNIASLRLFTVYGPRQRPEMAIHAFTRNLFEGRELPMFGDGGSRRDYTYIDDIVDGVLGALSAPPGYRVYNLGESSTISLDDLVALLERSTGIRAERRYLPPEPGDVPVTYADISRARAEIGYDPRVPVEEGVRRFVEWYRNVAGKFHAGGGRR